MPTYWIVLTVLLILNTHFLQKQYTWTDIGLHYLGVHAWFGDAYGVSINDSFWFITLILTLYLLYCAVQPWLGRADHVLLFGGIVSCGGALGLFFWNQPSGFFPSRPAAAGVFSRHPSWTNDEEREARDSSDLAVGHRTVSRHLRALHARRRFSFHCGRSDGHGVLCLGVAVHACQPAWGTGWAWSCAFSVVIHSKSSSSTSR